MRGQKNFTYEYDFGDGWEHTVTINAEFRTPPCSQVRHRVFGLSFRAICSCGHTANQEIFDLVAIEYFNQSR